MSLLARIISRAKWPATINDGINLDELPADAITGCLRTSSNTLSTWEIESLDSIDDVALAMISSAQKLEGGLQIITIDKEKALGYGFTLDHTDGNTPVTDLKKTHYDVSNLNYDSIGSFAMLVVEELRNNHIYSFNSTKLKQLLKKAIQDERLNIDDLKDGVRRKIS